MKNKGYSEYDVMINKIDEIKNGINELEKFNDILKKRVWEIEIRIKINSLDLITTVICNYFNENKEDLLTKKGNQSGKGELVKIRQICSLIACNDYRYSSTKVGKYLLRSHSSILSSKRKAQYFYDIERQFKIDVNNCKDLIMMENIKEL